MKKEMEKRNRAYELPAFKILVPIERESEREKQEKTWYK